MSKTLTWLAAVMIVLLGAGSARGLDYTDDNTADLAELKTEDGDFAGWVDGENIGVQDVRIVIANTDPITASDVTDLTIAGNGAATGVDFTGAGAVTFGGDAVAQGTDTGSAVLSVSGGASVTITGSTSMFDTSKLNVSGTYSTRGLLLNGNGAEVNVTGNGSFTDSSGSANILNGAMTLNTTGAVDIPKLVLAGENAVFNLMKTGATTLGEVDITQGTFNVDGAFTLADAVITNRNGKLDIKQGASLAVKNVALGEGDGAESVIAGTLTATGATLKAGAARVEGTMNATTFAMTGGALTVTGALNADDMTVSLGTFNIAAGSSFKADSLTVDGAATMNVSGTIKAGTAVAATAGLININESANVGEAAGLAALNVGGTAIVDVQSDVETRSFAFSGGIINIGVNKTLHADAMNGDFAGSMLLDGGVFDAGSGVAMRGKSAIITSTEKGGKISLGNNKLTVGKDAVLSAANADIEVSAAGGLDLQGTYIAGYKDGGVTKVTVTNGGGLTATGDAKIRLDTSLQTLAHKTDLENDAILVLMTDTAQGDTLALEWDNNATVYYYELRRNPAGDNKWGLYLVGAGDRSEAERYTRLLERWNANPKVDGHARKVIRPDYGKAISDATRLVMSGDIDNLSASGKFNARALNSLLDEAQTETVGYDALMLYNGSGNAAVNQAIMNSNAAFMRLLGRRNSLVHNEFMAGQTIGSDAALANGSYQTVLPNRAWASFIGSGENASSADGIAGYKYNPHGIAVGYDHLFGNITAGASFAYSGGSFEDRAALRSSSDIDTYAFALYGGYNHCSGVFVTGALGYGYSDNAIKDLRVLNNRRGWNRADYHTDTYMATLSVGYDVKPTDYLTVTPSIGFAYQYAENASHNQYFSASGANGTVAVNTLDVGRVKNHSTTMPLDLAVSYDFFGDEESLLTLTANIGWAHEFHNKGASGSLTYGGLPGIGPVDVVGRKQGRNIINAGFAAKYTYKQFEFGAGYDYVRRKDYNSHNYSASLGVNF